MCLLIKSLLFVLIYFSFTLIEGKNLAAPITPSSNLSNINGYKPLPINQGWLNWLLNLFIPKKPPSGQQSIADVDLNLWPGDSCRRYCSSADAPRICYYKWHLEHYHAMGPACGTCGKINGTVKDCFHPRCITADGVEKGVMSINRQIPGPTIHVCKNDLVVVDVINQMAGASTTIHWHGLHQRDTPFMDGVPFVTQCPIEFSTTFRYAFQATESGTQFYHSHAGHHKVNGLFGGLIIREPQESDPTSKHYDYDYEEHLILACDWMHDLGEMFMPGLPTRLTGILPDNVLINGRGRFTNRAMNITTTTPLQSYRVKRNGRYRFRFVNSASHICPLQLQIENHAMKIIASDSYPLSPVSVQTLISTSGERYDFVLETNQPPGDYLIRLRALGPCNRLQIEQFAILTYDNKLDPDEDESINMVQPTKVLPQFNLTFDSGEYMNHPNSTCFTPRDNKTCITEMDSEQIFNDWDLLNKPVQNTLILSFNNYRISNDNIFNNPDNWDHFMNTGNDVNLLGAINNISFIYPSISLLTQTNEINETTTFCDDGTRDGCVRPLYTPSGNESYCAPCVHRLKIPLNNTVEMVIVDEAEVIRELNHPFHIHGVGLHVISIGQHPLGIPMTRGIVRQWYNTRTFPVVSQPTSKKRVPPLKDTISIPSRGYAVVRFRASNPGFWLLHCHFDWHLAVGMGLIVQVGEYKDMKSAPENFPKCGNYLPGIQPLP